MPNVKFRTSRCTLTSYAGLSIIGQCLQTSGVDNIDGRFLTSLGMRTSDVVKGYLDLLCLGKIKLVTAPDGLVEPRSGRPAGST